MVHNRRPPHSIPVRPPSLWRSILAILGMSTLTLFLAFVGTSLALNGVSQMKTVLSLKTSGVEEMATVIRIDTTTLTVGENNRRQIISLPVMEFDYNERHHEFTAQAVRGDRLFEVGEQVAVVFPEGDPDSAVLSEFRSAAWAVPLALGVVLSLSALPFGWAVWVMSLAAIKSTR